MKLNLHKLGRIEDAAIELGKLTVFIGENGTNKTWAAYALHGLLRPLSRTVARTSEVTARAEMDRRLAAGLQEAYEAAVADPSGEVVRTIQVDSTAATRLLVLDSHRISSLLALDTALVADAHASLEYLASELPGSAQTLRIALRHGASIVVVSGDRQDGRGLEPRNSITDGTLKGLQAEVADSLSKACDSVLVLPAERISLSTSGLSKDDRPPVAILDFVDALQAAQAARERNGEWSTAKLQGILGGTLEYQGDVPVARRMHFRVGHDVVLPLHSAHSLVRAVAGLWAYLKKLAQPGDFVVIDELEMNAHPRAQLALAEFVALLVNKGLRVVFTTHSPYIIDHLQTLMEAAAAPAAAHAALAAQFALGTADAFISANDVAVHLFEAVDPDDPASQVKVRSVLDRERRTIDWLTFGRVSNEASVLYGSVLAAQDDVCG